MEYKEHEVLDILKSVSDNPEIIHQSLEKLKIDY